MSITNKVEVCFSPLSFELFKNEDSIVLVVDIFRATSAICAAFANGVDKIIPVATIEEAKIYKEKGYKIAAERDGVVLDFADFGNSPFNFTPERVAGKTIVYSTTNGTQAIKMAKKSYCVAIASFLNFEAICKWILTQEKDVLIFCAGWKNKFSLEDSVFAGAMVEALISSGKYSTSCDSAIASQDLWYIAKNNLEEYINKAAHRARLKNLNLDDVIQYCLTFNQTSVIPVLKDDILIDISVK